MPTGQVHARPLPKRLHPAKRAVLFSVYPVGWVWIVRHAVLLQARNALQFSSSAAAEVAATELLVAAFLHEINAVLAVAYVGKRSLLVTLTIGVQFLSAKTALAGFLVVLELLARASNVVGLHSA